MPAVETKHDVFRAIADPTRRRILTLLTEKEMSITSITKRFPITRTAVNKHLMILTDAGLVASRKSGREMRFKLQPEPLKEVQQWVSMFEKYWDDKLSSLRQYVESDE
ncbi:ArsR/SmtB family transcription factor [Tuberibacillus calidus]|jgi:DNA-binding transcriptional ArsR family regulator|uniref:ArsR/SmtB family transcription factor n=1 Tax=Tuberibacillus calidus TaxID=340097 RepID=UPI0004855928|nr:metalloregulator ArsR/SmtB family transcription factor [Tuberibacillus calidus]